MAHDIFDFDSVFWFADMADSRKGLDFWYDCNSCIKLVFWFDIFEKADLSDKEVWDCFDGFLIEVKVDFLEFFCDLLSLHVRSIIFEYIV